MGAPRSPTKIDTEPITILIAADSANEFSNKMPTKSTDCSCNRYLAVSYGTKTCLRMCDLSIQTQFKLTLVRAKKISGEPQGASPRSQKAKHLPKTHLSAQAMYQVNDFC